MTKYTKILIVLCVFFGLVFIIIADKQPKADSTYNNQPTLTNTATEEEVSEEASFPMFIETLRQREYQGDDFLIEQTLSNGTNYRQYVASYQSEGLKIYGLLTIPSTPKPENGYPVIVFVHGYIPPREYSTTKNYVSYQARLAKRGFVTFKPDLRGHGQSEGDAMSAHFSESHVVDVLSSIAYLKVRKDVDPSRIGYWGHSNGGETGLRAMVVSPDIKASVFWAGVVGSFEDMLETYNDKISFLRNANNPLILEYGLPSDNPDFWNKLDPYSYLSDISGSIQIHHGTSDSSVPIELSTHLKEELQKLNKTVEYYEYPGDNHNLSNNFNKVWERTIDFFETNL